MAVDLNGTVYFPFKNKLVAVSNAGAILWQFADQFGGSAPAIGLDGTLYIQGNGTLYAFAQGATPTFTPSPTPSPTFSASPTASLTFTPAPACQLASAQAADLVLGQTALNACSSNQGLSVSMVGLNSPWSSLVVGDKLVVADEGNQRVLIYNTRPSSNGQAADTVLGQSSSTIDQGRIAGPTGLAWDGSRLYVADIAFGRVMIFNGLPATNNAPASLVLGAGDFTSSGSFSNPWSLVSDGQHLLLLENGKNRLLVWNSLPSSNGQAPDMVLGQADFTGTSANQGNSLPGPGTLSNPRGLELKNGRLYVADTGNNRVLVWDSFPTSNGQAASRVIGASSLSVPGTAAAGDATSLLGPVAVLENNGSLFIGQNTQRISMFSPVPTSNNPAATGVLGWTDFSTSATGCSASTFSNLWGLAGDGSRLYAVDMAGNRVLAFDCSAANGDVVSSALARKGLGVTHRGLDRPLLLAPNPAHARATAMWQLDGPAKGARLKLFGVDGQLILARDLGPQAAGVGTLSLDLHTLASGIYLLVMETDQGQGWHVQARFKMALIR